jgi:hypothetical protein
MLILPRRLRSRAWPLVRGPRHQFSLGGLGSCSSPGSSPCCGCPVTFTVSCLFAHVNGATVTIKSGSTTVASGTTNSSGQVTLQIPSGGSYTVITSGSSCSDTTQTMTLACGGSYPIQCCPTCDNCNWPSLYDPLYITDSSQTVACPYGVHGAYWYGCYNLSVASRTTDACGCNNASAPTSGCCSIYYQISCSGTTLTIYRSWQNCVTHCSYCCDTLDGSCNPVAVSCPASLTCSTTGGSGITQDSWSGPLTGCDPFPLSVNLTLGTNFCSPTPLLSPLAAGITLNT